MSVVGRSMPHRVADMLAALVVKLGVQDAIGKRGDLVRVGHVEWDARMPDCNGCKKDREKAARSARALTRLPSEVTQDGIFQRKGLPVQLCEHCDGDALEEALKAHQRRIAKP